MIRRLLLSAIVATLLLGALALPAAPNCGGSASTGPVVAYADEIDLPPTPTPTPALPDGSCQSSGQCGS